MLGMSEIIYVLTNPVMPDLIKIGRTINLEERLRSLSSHTGVPVPFEVYFACTVADANKVEKSVHDAFGDHRVNQRREFFRLNPERVISVLQLVALEDVTPAADIVNDAEEQKSLDKERSRRSNFKFSSANVPVGSVLTFVRDEGITATVLDDRNVEVEGVVTSLSQSALNILTTNFGKTWTTVRGPDYWVYENETLSERRLRLEDESE